MSGRLLRMACTAVAATGALLAPVPAAAAPDPGPDTKPSVTQLLTDLQRLYRDAERATETYNATEEKLKKQRAQVARLDGSLARARLSLHDSRGAAGRLARQQYQNSSEISSYVRLLLARDPQHALDEGHLIGQLSQDRVETVDRLAVSEKRTDGLARAARKALDDQLTLTERRKKERDEVRDRLKEVEKLLASLSADQLAALAELERAGTAAAQQKLLASGALSSERAPSREGEQAVRYAVGQLGKPYEWGAEGPRSYDCSGLTSQAWERAGRPIPRTSQQQWAKLPRIPLNELRPGDLVIYFPEATHVALYLGDGLVVQAPRPGEKIKVSPIAANPLRGAVRPDPKAKPLKVYTPPTLSTPKGARGCDACGSAAPAQPATNPPRPATTPQAPATEAK
ncbi:NlpC/P60 family protein [Streptomyces sp. NPDC048275]|uniref:C40 family peptidase n=1 Tax=Streptomyces sp. NPDC048275 TaxID=3155629 RepID=UPI0033E6D150